MRQAGICVWQAHQLVRQIVAPGVTTAEIDAVIAEHFRQLRRRAAVQELSAPEQRPAAVSRRHLHERQRRSRPRHSQRTGRSREGDIVSVDTGCRLNGWCGDAAVTYPVGRIAPAVQRLLDVTVATLDLAFELMHTKSRWSQVAREMAQLRPRPRLLDGRVLRRPRHRPADARGAAGAEFPQPLAPRQRRLPHRAGPGDRRRADGEHGHQAREDASATTGPNRRSTASRAPISSTRSPSPNDGPVLLDRRPRRPPSWPICPGISPRPPRPAKPVASGG